MKIILSANGKNKLKMSKEEWISLAQKAGWLKIAPLKSNRDTTISIGPTPTGENCAQLGKENFEQLSNIEIKAFYHQCNRIFPSIPNGAQYIKTRNTHDFGIYYELGISYNSQDEEASNYALNVDNNLPEYWDEQAIQELKQVGYWSIDGAPEPRHEIREKI